MTEPDWQSAAAAGSYAGSADDLRDGYIHLSQRHQLEGTLARHFRNRSGLVLVAYDAVDLGPALRWDVSRGGDLFPHLYGRLPTANALWSLTLTVGPDGVPLLPVGVAGC